MNPLTQKQLLNDTLYPEITPFKFGHLKTDGHHEIYWEVSGNPDGIPVMNLHGGPGGGSSPSGRRFFDPEHYMIIQHDQRGCGKSLPFGSLENNTTEHLINDINVLADYLELKEFHIFGGSWGSTLSLAYAEAHPERCLSLTLRGIFMMRQEEIDWFMMGMGNFFPEAFDAFAEVFPDTPPEELLEVFYNALKGDDHALRARAAVAWSKFEATCCTLLPNSEMLAGCENQALAYPISLLEAHYFINNRFIPDDALLQNINRIRHIPARIIQGRYDVVCPPKTAWDLKKAWPEAELIIIPDAGHSSLEPGIAKALIESTKHFKHIS